MKKPNFQFIRKYILVAGMLLTIQAMGVPNKINIQKLNNALIFDLFINFEISEKNGNLSTIVDYVPNPNISDFKSIKVISNVAGENEISYFRFNEKGNLKNLSYEVSDRMYMYDFVYQENQLSSINIAGKKKIWFNYDKDGKLQSITREKSGVSFEYNIEYIEGENKANIKLIVIQGDKKRPSSRKYYVSWNDQCRLNAYYIDVYSSKNLTYSTKGDMISFSFANVMDDNNEAIWNYTNFDERGNWVERKYKETTCKRIIEYK